MAPSLSIPHPNSWPWPSPKVAASFLAWALLVACAPADLKVSTFTHDGLLETRNLAQFEGKIVALYYFTPW